MWVGFMTLEYVNLHYVGTLNKVRLFVYFKYNELDT